MTPAARIAAVIDILESLHADGAMTSSAAQALRLSMQRRRYAGSSDRNAIGDLFWQIQRGLSRLGWHLENCNAEMTGRHLVLAALVLIKRQHDVVSDLFSDKIKHAPAPLSEAEITMVAKLADRHFVDSAMPAHIALEWPEWLMEDATASLGDDLVANLSALTVPAATNIRVNPLKLSDQRQLRDRLAGRGIKGYPTDLSPFGVRLQQRPRLDELQDWKKGLFEIQDEGSQLASLLCDAQPGMQVADMCAGAGGKSLLMAAMMQNKGRILALDTSAERLERGGERLRRAGVHNVERKLVAEKWSSRLWRGKFDRVVVDAPCSGSGTWRRQVDARWQLTPERLAFYQKTQAILLEKARVMVASGGRIIYISCSLLASEGAEQIKNFLQTAHEFEPADIGDIWHDTVAAAGGGLCPPHQPGMLQLLPGRDGTDGFFIAILQTRLR
jgi:16S rRNA (cytosine967-C5)-methyltransferase